MLHVEAHDVAGLDVLERGHDDLLQFADVFQVRAFRCIKAAVLPDGLAHRISVKQHIPTPLRAAGNARCGLRRGGRGWRWRKCPAPSWKSARWPRPAGRAKPWFA